MKKITEKEKKFFKRFKEELRIFLISIAIISMLFSRSAECGNFEKVVEDCKTKEEVITISENFIKILSKEEQTQLSEEEKNTGEESELKEIKTDNLKKINDFLKEEGINVKNLDIEFNKKINTWKERGFLSSLLLDPRRKLIINPINSASSFVKENIYIIIKDNKYNFYIDVLTKIIIFNLIILFTKKEVKKNDDEEGLAQEEIMLKKNKEMLNEIPNLIISAFLTILIYHSFFTIEKEPLFIEKISKFQWIIISVLINNFNSYFIEKKKFKFNDLLLMSSISGIALFYFSSGKNIFFFYSNANLLISSILTALSNLKNKKKLSEINKEEEEPAL